MVLGNNAAQLINLLAWRLAREAFVNKQHTVAIFLILRKPTWKYGIMKDLFNAGLWGRLPIFIGNLHYAGMWSLNVKPQRISLPPYELFSCDVTYSVKMQSVYCSRKKTRVRPGKSMFGKRSRLTCSMLYHSHVLLLQRPTQKWMHCLLYCVVLPMNRMMSF